MKHFDVIAYAYEADYHCPDCTRDRFGANLESATDNEGNEVHPVFVSDEWYETLHFDDPIQFLACSDCHEIIDEWEQTDYKAFLPQELATIDAELKRADIQVVDDIRQQIVFLGTVMALLPSGKYYTAWANSNVTEAEARIDEAWTTAAERQLEKIDAILESGPDDPCDLFAVRVVK